MTRLAALLLVGAAACAGPRAGVRREPSPCARIAPACEQPFDVPACERGMAGLRQNAAPTWTKLEPCLAGARSCADVLACADRAGIDAMPGLGAAVTTLVGK